MKIVMQIRVVFLAGSLIFLDSSMTRLYAAEEETPATRPPVSDQRLGHQIHNTIVSDASLPYCAHVVNVQAEKGVVTLKGRVHTRAQRDNLKKKAAKFVGEKNVITDIRVQGTKS